MMISAMKVVIVGGGLRRREKRQETHTALFANILSWEEGMYCPPEFLHAIPASERRSLPYVNNVCVVLLL